MLVPNRHGNTKEYRYGFQGQEKDDEIRGGEGNSLNYTYRMHDPRIGRFFTPDPLEKKYPNYTPYSFSGNKVIHSVELEGLEDSFYMLGKKIYNGETYFELINVLEIGGEVELFTGTKMKTAYADRVHVYGSDGHWHTMSDKLRGTSLNKLGGSEAIFAEINKGKNVDKGYEMASKLKSLESIGNTAALAINLAYLAKAFKDIKGVKSIINWVKKNSGTATKEPVAGSIAQIEGSITKLSKQEMALVVGGDGQIRPEKIYLGSKKHGIKWNEGPNLAKSSQIAQGKWGKNDLEFATQKAATLKAGESAYFELPVGADSKVYLPDGTSQSATHIWIRNNGTGTFHGHPRLNAGE